MTWLLVYSTLSTLRDHVRVMCSGIDWKRHLHSFSIFPARSVGKTVAGEFEKCPNGYYPNISKQGVGLANVCRCFQGWTWNGRIGHFQVFTIDASINSERFDGAAWTTCTMLTGTSQPTSTQLALVTGNFGNRSVMELMCRSGRSTFTAGALVGSFVNEKLCSLANSPICENAIIKCFKCVHARLYDEICMWGK